MTRRSFLLPTVLGLAILGLGYTRIPLHGAAAAEPAPGQPTITAFAPTEGEPGTVVTITGTGFIAATGVAIGPIALAAEDFAVQSDTTITATVPETHQNDPLAGRIKVTTPDGSAVSDTDFTVLVAP